MLKLLFLVTHDVCALCFSQCVCLEQVLNTHEFNQSSSIIRPCKWNLKSLQQPLIFITSVRVIIAKSYTRSHRHTTKDHFCVVPPVQEHGRIVM